MAVYIVASHAPVFLLLRRNFCFLNGHNEYRENLLIIISFLIMAICLAVTGTGIIGLWAFFSGMALAGLLRGF